MVNVLLLDDHSVVRTGYRRLIDAEPDLQVVGGLYAGRELIRGNASMPTHGHG